MRDVAAKLTLAALALLLVVVRPALAQAPVRLTVALITSRSLEPYNLAAAGITAALSDAGYAPVVDTFNLDGDATSAGGIVSRLRQERHDVILTLGSLATTEVARGIDDIPLVFCMVLDPPSSGLTAEGEASGRNITGVSMDIPIDAQLDAIEAVLPTAKRVGILHSAESTAQVAKAEAAANARGLSIVATQISSEREVSRAMTSLLTGSDVLLALPDAAVYTESSTRYVLLSTLRQAMPFVGLMDSFVSAGAFMGVGLDFVDLGRQAGAIAARIAQGEAPGAIPVEGPAATRLLFNQRTARRIGVNIPPEALAAGEVLVP